MTSGVAILFPPDPLERLNSYAIWSQTQDGREWLATPRPGLDHCVAAANKFQPEAANSALIAAVTSGSRSLTAVQLTYLDPDTGAKAKTRIPKQTFGRLGNGAVKLGASDKYGRLGLAEGIETALSATQITSIPWATLGVARLGKIALPDVKTLSVFADNGAVDEALRAAKTYKATGYKVFLSYPADFERKDFNDLLRQRQ
jgi:putative DNA primase/helicase